MTINERTSVTAITFLAIEDAIENHLTGVDRI